ncbi:hypothetical protein FOZ62_022147 [Perkinsus olseni]|uniref:Uncharacterized protein n=1 Tax=Perkinsus olseni TaxID=32597 RepID=A0A7J6Q3Q8_PEROL|nr:hypothetical protein FOZ62_022147 [Perkinsus olseni]
MQFTSQQLCGGARYKPTCRIGNWCEEVELNDLRMKEYVSKKEGGDLLVISKQLMLERALQPSVAKLKGNEGTLRNGDTVMLRNAASECFLSGNAEERIPGRKSTAYAVTTGPNATPCVRNVFAVELVNTDDKNAEEPVRYGDEVRLRLRGFIPDSDCYLYSEMVSALAASKCSRKQEVGALDKPAGNTRWQILHPDGKMRFETEGEPIKADQPVVIKHLSTGSYLASDKIKQMNIFGAENEVHAHCYYSTNKTHNMNSEKKGEITGDYALRRHELQNIWQLSPDDAERAFGDTIPPASFGKVRLELCGQWEQISDAKWRRRPSTGHTEKAHMKDRRLLNRKGHDTLRGSASPADPPTFEWKLLPPWESIDVSKLAADNSEHKEEDGKQQQEPFSEGPERSARIEEAIESARTNHAWWAAHREVIIGIMGRSLGGEAEAIAMLQWKTEKMAERISANSSEYPNVEVPVGNGQLVLGWSGETKDTCRKVAAALVKFSQPEIIEPWWAVR